MSKSEPETNGKLDRRQLESLEKKEKVYELIKEKHTRSEIARKLGITGSAVDWFVKKLKAERKNKRR